MKKILTALLLSSSFLIGLPASADSNQPPRSLTTTGIGEVKVAADKAVVRMQVETIHRSASNAKTEVDNRVNVLLEKLKSMNIKEKDIIASSLRINPNFEYQDQKAVFSGYHASRDVVVTLHKLGDLNALLDAAVESGINQISQVALESSQAEKYQEEARQLAIADSKAKAESLAAAYGAQLGPIYSINYQSSRPMQAPKMEMAMARMASDSSGGQYLHDEITFGDTIAVVFELIIPH